MYEGRPPSDTERPNPSGPAMAAAQGHVKEELNKSHPSWTALHCRGKVSHTREF